MSLRPHVSALAVLFCCALAMSQSARASTVVYDPFDSPAGDALENKTAPNGQSWATMSANAADDDIVVGSTNLAVNGLAAPRGNSIVYGGARKNQPPPPRPPPHTPRPPSHFPPLPVHGP